ncbi:MAG: IS3 family transposase [Flavobacteriaceae bacterium]|nr:IS3 family transposase [Flavobacteriaceae bacterium]
MNQLYKTISISKQAVYQYRNRQISFDKKLTRLVMEADELRLEHPGCGVEKMYYTLSPSFIGRDHFIEIMMELGYRLKVKKNYKRTTTAGKIYYPNLIKGIEVTQPNTVWQSDITYIPLNNRHYYAVFIIDVYTKKIVGYSITDHMRASANMQALKMALKDNPAPQIHHSDRGSQYTYKKYIELLKSKGSDLSMSLSGMDNAYAERINRTIKEEYLYHWKPKDYIELRSMIKKAVKNYNNKRIHNHLDRTTPKQYEQTFPLIKSKQRKKLIIFNNEN